MHPKKKKITLLLSTHVCTHPKVIFIILSEIGLGLSGGLLLSILFSAASVSAEKMASTAGLSMANMIDPQSGGQTLVISTVLSLFLIRAW